MKMKLFGICITLLLVLGIAAPGHANLGTGELVRVVYDTTTGTEVATDLGSMATILATSGTETLGGAGALIGSTSPTTLTDLNASTGTGGWTTTKVAYFYMSFDTAQGMSTNNNDPLNQLYLSSTASSVTKTYATAGGPPVEHHRLGLYRLVGLY